MTTVLALLLMTFSIQNNSEVKSIHDFEIQLLNSDEILNLSDFKGKKMLVVNVASMCGYTPQYKELETLSRKFGDQVAIVAFPCDQFGGQELDTEPEIEEFCSEKFQVSFPITTIIDVKGENQHPIYQYLTKEEMNGLRDYKVSWNFNKFLLDENGKLLAYFPSKVTPTDEAILKLIKQ